MNKSYLGLPIVTLMLLTGCQTAKNPFLARAEKDAPVTAPLSFTDAATSMDNNDADDDPPQVAQLMKQGDTAFASGDLIAAERHYKQALKQESNLVDAHHRLAVIADLGQRFDDAEQHYQAALAKDPTNASILSDFGYSFFLQAKYEQSEKSLLQAHHIDATHKKTIANLSLVYAKQGREDDTLAMLRKAYSETEAQAKLTSLFPGVKSPAAEPSVSDTLMADNSLTEAPASPADADDPQDPQDFVRQLKEKMEQERIKGERERLRRQQAQGGTLASTNAGTDPQPGNGGPVDSGMGVSPFDHPSIRQAAVAATQPAVTERAAQPRTPEVTPGPASQPMFPVATVETARADHVEMASSVNATQPAQAANQSMSVNQHMHVAASVPQTNHQTWPPTSTPSEPTPSTMIQQAAGTRLDAPETINAAVPYYRGTERTTAEPSNAGVHQAGGDASSFTQNLIADDTSHTRQPVRPSQMASGQSSHGSDILLAQTSASAASPFVDDRPALPHSRDMRGAATSRAAPRPLTERSQSPQQEDSMSASASHAGHSAALPAMARNTAGTGQSQAAASTNSYREATHAAAALGLQAGPGQMFPVMTRTTPRMHPGTGSRLGTQFDAPQRMLPTDNRPLPTAQPTAIEMPAASMMGNLSSRTTGSNEATLGATSGMTVMHSPQTMPTQQAAPTQRRAPTAVEQFERELLLHSGQYNNLQQQAQSSHTMTPAGGHLPQSATYDAAQSATAIRPMHHLQPHAQQPGAAPPSQPVTPQPRPTWPSAAATTMGMNAASRPSPDQRQPQPYQPSPMQTGSETSVSQMSAPSIDTGPLYGDASSPAGNVQVPPPYRPAAPRETMQSPPRYAPDGYPQPSSSQQPTPVVEPYRGMVIVPNGSSDTRR